MSGFGDAVDDLLLHLGGERQHAAENFANGRDVILRDPLAELEQPGVEDGLRVERGDHSLDLDLLIYVVGLRSVVVQLDDDANHALSTKGDEDASADDGFGFADPIGERRIERDGDGDVAEVRHSTPL